MSKPELRQEDIIYADKIRHFEKIFESEIIDRGGHWQEQPLSPDAPNFVEELRQRFQSMLKVLDLGSGTGRHTIMLAELGLNVIGVEITKAGVLKSWSFIEGTNYIQKVRFLRGNVLDLPFLEGSFEGFHDFCTLSHLHIKDWGQYFIEAARVLKLGGLGTIIGFSGEDEAFYGVPIRKENIGWLEFRDGQVFLEKRSGERCNHPHQYPPRYENMSWYFATGDQIYDLTTGLFKVRKIELWDHPAPNPENGGHRDYLNILLERV